MPRAGGCCSSCPVDLVIVDVRLGAYNGLQLIVLAQSLPSPPRPSSRAGSMTGSWRKRRERSARRSCLKPIDPPRLLALITELLATGGPRPEPHPRLAVPWAHPLQLVPESLRVIEVDQVRQLVEQDVVADRRRHAGSRRQLSEMRPVGEQEPHRVRWARIADPGTRRPERPGQFEQARGSSWVASWRRNRSMAGRGPRAPAASRTLKPPKRATRASALRDNVDW